MFSENSQLTIEFKNQILYEELNENDDLDDDEKEEQEKNKKKVVKSLSNLGIT